MNRITLYWRLGAIYLFCVNISRMIWLIISHDPLEGLWLSQIIGTIQGIIFWTEMRHKALNGFYLAIAPLPFAGFIIYLPLGADILFYFNHFPHIFLFYLLKHRDLVDMRGFHLSMLFMLLIMNITWYLEYKLDLFVLAINTTTSPYFPVVLIIGGGWYLYVYHRISKMDEKIQQD